MRKIKLYIASSLDGYIARPNGSVDWLEGLPNPDQLDYGYFDFIASVDTVLMGRNSYEQILSFDIDWPYAEYTSYVFTRNPNLALNSPNTELMTFSPDQLQALKQGDGKDIWLLGGGQLTTTFLKAGLIDELIIFITPVMIGKGVRLFPESDVEAGFELLSSQTYATGMVELRYGRK